MSYNGSNNNNDDDDPDEQACRHCGSCSLNTDWAQGDRVCTQCVVVDAEKLLETRAEWREFNDADDLAKGRPAVARCGLVPVDESRYLGGLQPTSLSKAPFGGNVGGAHALQLSMMRKRLQTTNRKLDRLMGQRHARALKNARVSRLVRKRQLLQAGNSSHTTNPNETDQSDLDSVVTADDDVRPELEHILIQEEEDVHRMQAALNADKWSLRRAILLHGQHESLLDSSADNNQVGNALSERDDLQQRLDSKLRKASADLYAAYQMLLESSRRLQLPDRVTHEATTMLCRYAARRDGFSVKGVSSRLAVKKNNLSAAQHKRAADSLREHNKLKQMGSLCAALLLLTARKLGWPRPLTEVCGSVQPLSSSTASAKLQQSPYSDSNNDSTFIKAKHCSRAMGEIKSAFPDYARSIAVSGTTATIQHSSSSASVDDPVSTIHYVDHAVRKLQLPPVAEASVRALVWHCRQEQSTTGQNSGTKLSTLCASLAYFVCLAGSVMQRLASQAQTREQDTRDKKRKSTNLTLGTASRKMESRKNNSMGPPRPKKPKLVSAISISTSNHDDKQSSTEKHVKESEDDKEEDDESFDVFSHGVGSELLAQKQEYEMRRVWDTWAEQTTWLRSLSDVEQSSGVSSNTILAHYKSNIYPRRQALLECLRDAVQNGAVVKVEESISSTDTANPIAAPTNILTETPLASVLLSHVVAATPLLNPSGKHEGIRG